MPAPIPDHDGREMPPAMRAEMEARLATIRRLEIPAPDRAVLAAVTRYNFGDAGWLEELADGVVSVAHASRVPVSTVERLTLPSSRWLTRGIIGGRRRN